MSNAALAQILDRWAESPGGDLDSALLTRFLTDRDDAAFAGLVRRHGPLVYGTCQRTLGNRAEADDAFQAVFFVLARKAHTLHRDRSVGPWLHGVALRVARKLRGQIVQRRLRDMAAAKSERVDEAEPRGDFWAVVDEELARLSEQLREVVLLCDLGGHSHARAAKALGLAKGTVTKRLAKAHQELAARLGRRGLTLGLGTVATVFAARATASVPATLLADTARGAVAFSVGSGGGSVAVQTLAEGVMRSIKVGALRVWLFVGVVALALAGGGYMLAGGPGGKPGDARREQPRAAAKPEEAKVGAVWTETFTVEYPGRLPASVAFSADGKTLLTGDTGGEVMALISSGDQPTYRWKVEVGGSHAAVAYSADGKAVYATTKDGVRVLAADTGKELGRIEAKDSNPLAIGVFPNKVIDPTFTQCRIVFGNARGYFIESWADGKLATTAGTITTSTVAKGGKPADDFAVPLALDPKGRSAIMTGPLDGQNRFGRGGKNVLWAYVCGDYEKGSPGNRVMDGHTATVVSAAWAKDGGTAVTGDADGRVIVWDAKTMKESRRVELGGRVAALTISPDGTRAAAYVLGKRGDVYAWETAKPANPPKSIHTDLLDFGGAGCYASLAFSADGKRLAGCAGNKAWLTRLGELVGKARVWDLVAEPKAQLPPKPAYTKELGKGASASFVVLNNESVLTATSKEGALDFRNVREGYIQARIVLGDFTIGGMKLSTDRNWLAVEQRPRGNADGPFEVGVYKAPLLHKATVPACSQLLDVASGGTVAVVREKAVELWDVATAKKLKAAPFTHTRIDAARFSPDGKLLAVVDRNELVLWRWEDDKHERIDLGRGVGSLAFSPDGKFLAEGPTDQEGIQVRDVETRKVVRTLAHDSKRPMTVAGLTYAQGGRVLIASDRTAPHRVHLWDTETGAVAHQLAVPSGVPLGVGVSPTGRYLVAMTDDGAAGLKLTAWRLDGELPAAPTGATPPPATGR